MPEKRTYLRDHLMVDHDWGSTGLWVKIEGDGWANTRYEWHDVPDWLVARFDYWCELHERSAPDRPDPEELDEEAFDAYGLSLAIDLKRVLGPDVHVFYGPKHEVAA